MLFLHLGEDDPHLPLDDKDALLGAPPSTVCAHRRSFRVESRKISRLSGLCTGCRCPIVDRYFLMVGESEALCWHQECLKCSVCETSLQAFGSCFLRDGMVYCRQDYSERFAKQCDRCSLFLDLNDMVMRARGRVYHVECFICSVCQLPLQPGHMFALGEEGSLFCQNHYEPLLAFRPSVEPSIYESPTLVPSLTTPPKCKSSRRPKKEETLSDADTELNEDESSSGGSRSKRMRTSFKHHQLRTMKNYFHLNHNPDAKDLHSLAQKTGLTKRVLQVWFQNARAKYRRSCGSTSSGSITIGGVAGTRESASASPSIRSASAAVESTSSDYFQHSVSPTSDDSSKTLTEFFEHGQML
uniref:LIM/homeobox protein Lhx9-like n=1 Tax=Steinernema glaseri TaxID=37863 RepID=A0A1I7YMH3_9BILA